MKRAAPDEEDEEENAFPLLNLFPELQTSVAAFWDQNEAAKLRKVSHTMDLAHEGVFKGMCERVFRSPLTQKPLRLYTDALAAYHRHPVLSRYPATQMYRMLFLWCSQQVRKWLLVGLFVVGQRRADRPLITARACDASKREIAPLDRVCLTPSGAITDESASFSKCNILSTYPSGVGEQRHVPATIVRQPFFRIAVPVDSLAQTERAAAEVEFCWRQEELDTVPPRPHQEIWKHVPNPIPATVPNPIPGTVPGTDAPDAVAAPAYATRHVFYVRVTKSEGTTMWIDGRAFAHSPLRLERPTNEPGQDDPPGHKAFVARATDFDVDAVYLAYWPHQNNVVEDMLKALGEEFFAFSVPAKLNCHFYHLHDDHENFETECEMETTWDILPKYAIRLFEIQARLENRGKPFHNKRLGTHVFDITRFDFVRVNYGAPVLFT